jgi:hypothetical protein
MLARLATERRRLKSLQSVARKVEVKRELLPGYTDYVAGALAGGRGAQDDVLMTLMIWRIDTGDHVGALDIARYALRHGLTLPDQYERSTAAAIAEEFAEAALATLRDGSTFDGGLLAEVAQLTLSTDMHDQIRAKLYKARGLAYAPAAALAGDTPPAAALGDTGFALESLRRALQLDAHVGVKQHIARLEKALVDATGNQDDRT